MNTIESFAPDRPRMSGKGRLVCAPAGALLALTALVLSACASSPAGRGAHTPSAADVALVRYTSCGDALRNLRAAATTALSAGASSGGAAGPSAASGSAQSGSGLQPGSSARSAVGGAPSNEALGQNSVPGSGSYSGTNTATPGVDEPDLVKTDGQRIVTISGGVLRVVDAHTGQLTGALDLRSGGQYPGLSPANLLLAGDHALVLFSPAFYGMSGPAVSSGGTGSGAVIAPGSAASQGAASPGTALPIEGPR